LGVTPAVATVDADSGDSQLPNCAIFTTRQTLAREAVRWWPRSASITLLPRTGDGREQTCSNAVVAVGSEVPWQE
jgi:hypothetical protein